MTGHPKEALSLATKGLNQLETLKAEKQLIAYATRSRGMAYVFAGNVAEALLDLRRALELFEQLDDIYTVASCHHEIGYCLERQGNISGAEHHYKQAFKTWEALGNANDLANTLNSLGVCAYLRGNHTEAIERFNDSLEIALQIGAIRRAAFAQAGIGDVYLDRQEYEEAKAAYKLSTQFTQEVRVRSLEIYNLIKIGECFYGQDDLAQALQLATQAEEIATETGLNIEKGLAAALQGKIYTRRSEYTASFTLFAEAMSCLAEGDILERAKVNLWWSYSLFLDLRPLAAFEQLQEAIKLALAMGDLLQGLRSTITETRHLLLHFLHRADTLTGTKDSIQLLLAQDKQRIEVISPSLQVFAFGVPYLIVSDRLKRFHQRGRIRTAPELLLYLILEGQDSGCRRDEVSLVIWPDADRDKSIDNFHQTLRRLRDSIFANSSYIIIQDDYYQVNPNYLKWSDVLAFEKLFARSTATSSEETLSLQLELIALYQGQFLAGFELNEWGMTYRTLCEIRFLQVVGLAGKQLLASGEPQEALAIIQKGLTHDYFREDLHQGVLRAYAQLELYDDLATHYADLCQTFNTELGGTPNQNVQQLYQQLMMDR